ncbi:magnesium transporter CorA family protein [Aquicella lusitana]|uniref:Magnesium/cobalt transport protein CorA n=1 Tax=Aquicella lusitana TaxID=254246 RepID=A0A370GS71_9COXI|nr:magnesium transporter CorA family protein [Aquicella lusitana]RDI46555.1 magnesium/cobalt transport protein CorA [Aquicella lusitana]VVC74219.1 Magnesium transport protein CorA [Aquicella lusitana]
MAALPSTVIEFDLSDHSFRPLRLDELVISRQEKNKIYWVHCDLNDKDTFRQLSVRLQLPEDVIQLCEEDELLPKLNDSDESLTMRIQCLLPCEPHRIHHDVDFGNVVIHLTQHYCFTAASHPIPALSSFMHNYPKAVKYAKTPCFILFLMLDNAINDYSEMLLEFDLVTDQIDLRIRETHKNIYDEVIDIKKQVMKIKRYAAAIRDILMRISGRKITVVSERCRASLANLFDHSQVIISEADAIRDILNSSLDQIDNALMQNMSNTMKVLTAFAAIFLPLSLIAGIYGMNFEWMPELHWKYGYFWALSLMVVCGVGLLLLFKKMKWF